MGSEYACRECEFHLMQKLWCIEIKLTDTQYKLEGGGPKPKWSVIVDVPSV